MATSFHGFEVKQKIGAGGMSTVYKGIHKTLGYPVAIKILHPGLAGDSSFISRFEREAKAASAIRTSNIASVIDFGSEDDVYFIVMEYIDGKDLGKLFSEIQESNLMHKGFPAEVTLMILEEVADGLKEAHTRGIIHRDIKPSNILLNGRGEVKIADFGLARDTGDIGGPGRQDLTRPGMVVGTPSYMSPEQAAGKDQLDHRTDIFSLGVMAYQLLTGEKPFQGDNPTSVQERIISDDPEPLTPDRCPLLTPEIESLIDKMLAKDPDKRYQSMEQVLRALSDCLDSIDNISALIKYKRDYLSRFAADPVGTAEDLRQKNISSHLKRGYHYKKMGLSNIGDAIREFSYVIYLDPKNSKASEAIKELEKKAEESGMRPAATPRRPAVDSSRTMILPEAAAPPRAAPGRPAAAAPAKPAGGGRLPPWLGRRGLLAGGAVVAVALIAWIVIGQRGGGEEQSGSRTGGQVAEGASGAPSTGWLVLASEPSGARVRVRRAGSDEEPTLLPETTPLRRGGFVPGIYEIILEKDGFETATRSVTVAAGDTLRQAVVLTPVAARPAETPTETTPKPPVPEQPVETAPQPGRILVTSSPSEARVYLRQREGESFTLLGTTPCSSDDLVPGRWEIRVEKDGYQGKSSVVRLRAGERRDLPLSLTPEPVAPPPPVGDGWLRVVVAPFADIYLDNQLVAEGTKVAVLTVAGGRDHKVELRHPPTFGRIELTGLKVAPGDTLEVPHQAFHWGALRMGANVAAFVTVDGRELGQQTPYLLERLATGDHTVGAHLDGYRVERAILNLPDGSRRELQPVNPGGTPQRFLISVKENEEVKLRFLLSPNG